MPRPEIILTPELLRTFVTLIQCDGSVSRTAEALGINEASVSKRIKPLHSSGTGPRVGRLLWLRKVGKTFFPTDEGTAMYDMAIDQLRRWELFTAIATTERLPLVTFACGQEAVTGFVRDAVKQFHTSTPNVMLRLSTQRGRDRILGVAGGQFDLAVVGHDPNSIQRLARRDLHIEDLFPDPLMLACSQRGTGATQFKQGGEGPVAPDEMRELPLILPEVDSGIRQELSRHLEKAGVSVLPGVRCEVGGWGVILQFVQDGLGIGLLPRSVIQRASSKLLSRPLDGKALPLRNTSRLIARPRSSGGLELSEYGERFLNVLREVTQSLRGESPSQG